jgi:hypothetical protein
MSPAARLRFGVKLRKGSPWILYASRIRSARTTNSQRASSDGRSDRTLVGDRRGRRSAVVRSERRDVVAGLISLAVLALVGGRSGLAVAAMPLGRRATPRERRGAGVRLK